MTVSRRRARTLLAGGLCLATLSAGCAADDSGDADDEGSPPAAASGTPPPPGPTSTSPTSPADATLVPTAAPADPDLQAAATRYLAARENAISHTHPDARAWLQDARPAMTPTGWQRLARSLGDSGGSPAEVAREHRWSVRVTADCQHHPDAGPPGPTAATLVCELTDRTIDAAGIPVPTDDLPALWPYDGPQPGAVLAMRRHEGQWVVDADQTGLAG